MKQRQKAEDGWDFKRKYWNIFYSGIAFFTELKHPEMVKNTNRGDKR